MSALFDSEYAARALDVAREALRDIPACHRADLDVRWLNGAPCLVVAFTEPESVQLFGDTSTAQSAMLVRLVPISRSEPLRACEPLTGERLRRHIRNSVEHYLAKHGVAIDRTFGDA